MVECPIPQSSNPLHGLPFAVSFGRLIGRPTAVRVASTKYGRTVCSRSRHVSQAVPSVPHRSVCVYNWGRHSAACNYWITASTRGATAPMVRTICCVPQWQHCTVRPVGSPNLPVWAFYFWSLPLSAEINTLTNCDAHVVVSEQLFTYKLGGRKSTHSAESPIPTSGT